MVSGIGSYQQTVNLTQTVTQTTRETQTQQEQRFELRERDRAKDGTVVSRNQAETLTRSNEQEKAREERRHEDALGTQPTPAGGKDLAQRRGSLLDTTV